MTIDTTKLGFQTFDLTYSDGSKDIVKPVSWKYLDDVQILQFQILQNCASKAGSPGDLLSPKNKDFWDSARKLADLMPLVGTEEKGIDIDRIEDMNEILEIFVTTTKQRDENTGFIIPEPKLGYLRPSRISKINGINFIRLLMEVKESLA
jgi:hypothetical protein